MVVGRDLAASHCLTFTCPVRGERVEGNNEKEEEREEENEEKLTKSIVTCFASTNPGAPPCICIIFSDFEQFCHFS